MKLPSFLAILLLLAGCATSPAGPARGCQPQAPETYRLAEARPTGALLIHVISPDGAPLAGVRFSVYNHYAPGELRPTCPGGAFLTTDTEGNVRFERLYVGTIEAFPSQHPELSQIADIRAGETSQLRFVVKGPLPTPMPEPSQ